MKDGRTPPPPHPPRSPLLLLLLCSALPAQAQSVRAYVLQDSVLLGERFRLAVAATHPPGVVPVFPDEGVADSALLAGGLMLGDVEVLRRMERAVQDTPGGEVDSVVYEAATFALDSAAVGPIPVQVGTAEVQTTPFWLPVKATLPPEAQGIRDLAPLAEFPVPLWRWLLVGLAFAAVVGTLAYLLVRYRLRRDRHVPEVLPPPPLAVRGRPATAGAAGTHRPLPRSRPQAVLRGGVGRAAALPDGTVGGAGDGRDYP